MRFKTLLTLYQRKLRDCLKQLCMFHLKNIIKSLCVTFHFPLCCRTTWHRVAPVCFPMGHDYHFSLMKNTYL